MPKPAAAAPALRPRSVRPRTLAAVAERLGIAALPDPAALTGITHDSRSVRPGDLYAALPGARYHGADFTAAARDAGAGAVLTDPAGAAAARLEGLPVLVVDDPRARLGPLAAWIYGDPGAEMTLIGVTGTNGKTTVAYFVEAVLRAGGRRTGLIGTIETRIGDRAVASARTTPESTDLQALLAVMRERGTTAVVLEVSSHALALGRVDGLIFDVAVFTNLSQDHLDFHADLEDYFAAKAALFTPARSRLGVVNVDDSYGARLAADAPVPVTTVSPTGTTPADWHVTSRDARSSAASTPFTLRHSRGTSWRPVSPLAGDFNVANAALAAVACLSVGVAGRDVVRGLSRCGGVPGRMERVQSTGDDEPLAVVDYAHSPDAVTNVLTALRPGLSGRLVVVLGAGGDRDRAKRRTMGAAAAEHADRVVVTDDNPRSEDPAAIRAAVLAGAREAAAASGAEVVEIADRELAIRSAARGLGRGDALVVAGKGHEQGQEVAGTVHPFDDRRVLRQALDATRDERDSEVLP